MKRQLQVSYLADLTQLTYFEVNIQVEPGPSNFQATWEYNRKTNKFNIKVFEQSSPSVYLLY
jgi:hypothetical protein